jgi:ubiquinone/menaquinone biosynthesis C-methylase UbiE/uncharacterized protein YbaR (Trm112 family)
MKDRIYEKLIVEPEPAGYKGKIPWVVQQQVAATNGIHFLNSIGELNEYPIPEIPVSEGGPGKLLLDIGCGWGRWLVAAFRKNYIPIGIDIRLEFCETSRTVIRDNGGSGYAVVADLQQLPFQNNSFDTIWSFSVIQHTHYKRLVSCLSEIERTLNVGGYCFLEFPNSKGFRNRFGPASKPNNMNFESWDVRYYSPQEYREIFSKYFDNFQYHNHSALGIGILPGDLKYTRGFKNRSLVGLSRALSKIADLIQPLKQFSDSIYIKASKSGHSQMSTSEKLSAFLAAHQLNPADNLNIVHLLQCPASHTALRLSEDRAELISREAGLAYPIVNQIPILISSEAKTL